VVKSWAAQTAEPSPTRTPEAQRGATSTRRAPARKRPGKIGVNSRNLRTLSVDPRVHDELAARMPASAVTVAESGLREHADLERLGRLGYRAFLVGERLIAQDDPGAALRTLRGTR